MAALTWREVSAPNLNSSTNAFFAAGDGVNRALSGLSTAITGIRDQKRTENTDAVLAQVLGATDRGSVQSLIQSALAGGQRGGPIDLTAIGETGNRMINTLTQREEMDNRLLDQQAGRDITPLLAAELANARNTGQFNVGADFSQNRVAAQYLDEILGAANNTRNFNEDGRRWKIGDDRDAARFAFQQQQARAAEARAAREEARRNASDALFGAVSSAVNRHGKAGTAKGDISETLTREMIASGQIKTMRDFENVTTAANALIGLNSNPPRGTVLGTNNAGKNITAGSLATELANVSNNAARSRGANEYQFLDSNIGAQIWNDAKGNAGKSIKDLGLQLAGEKGNVAKAQQDILNFAKANNVPNHVAASALEQSQRPIVPSWMNTMLPVAVANHFMGNPSAIDQDAAKSRGTLVNAIGKLGGQSYIDTELSRANAPVEMLEARAKSLVDQINWNATYGNEDANGELVIQLDEINRSLQGSASRK